MSPSCRVQLPAAVLRRAAQGGGRGWQRGGSRRVLLVGQTFQVVGSNPYPTPPQQHQNRALSTSRAGDTTTALGSPQGDEMLSCGQPGPALRSPLSLLLSKPSDPRSLLGQLNNPKSLSCSSVLWTLLLVLQTLHQLHCHVLVLPQDLDILLGVRALGWRCPLSSEDGAGLSYPWKSQSRQFPKEKLEVALRGPALRRSPAGAARCRAQPHSAPQPVLVFVQILYGAGKNCSSAETHNPSLAGLA